MQFPASSNFLLHFLYTASSLLFGSLADLSYQAVNPPIIHVVSRWIVYISHFSSLLFFQKISRLL